MTIEYIKITDVLIKEAIKDHLVLVLHSLHRIKDLIPEKPSNLDGWKKDMKEILEEAEKNLNNEVINIVTAAQANVCVKFINGLDPEDSIKDIFGKIEGLPNDDDNNKVVTMIVNYFITGNNDYYQSIDENFIATYINEKSYDITKKQIDEIKNLKNININNLKNSIAEINDLLNDIFYELSDPVTQNVIADIRDMFNDFFYDI